MMNGRQIRELLGRQGANIDPRLGRVIISMSDDMHTMKQQIQLLAGMFDQMCNLMNTFGSAVGEVQRLQAEDLRRKGVEVSTDPMLTGEGAEDDGLR